MSDGLTRRNREIVAAVLLDGESMRAVGKRFGLSHVRVSAIVARWATHNEPPPLNFHAYKNKENRP